MTLSLTTNVAEVTLRVRAAGISSAPFFITVRNRADDTVGGAIRMLNTAKWVLVARERPDGYALLCTHDATVRMGENTPISSHTRYILFETSQGDRVCIELCISFDRAAYREFWSLVNAGPKVIGGTPPDDTTDPIVQSFVDWLKQDLSGGDAPAYITEVRYVSSSVEPDIRIVRKKQEHLIQSIYGERYQDDMALHRAIRVADRINERYVKSGLDFLVHQNADRWRSELNKLLQEETGLEYYTLPFSSGVLVRDIYTAETGHSSQYGATVEYLRLDFIYPEEEKEQLIERFRQSVKDGLVLTKTPWGKDD